MNRYTPSLILKDNHCIHVNRLYNRISGSSRYVYDDDTRSIVDRKRWKKELDERRDVYGDERLPDGQLLKDSAMSVRDEIREKIKGEKVPREKKSFYRLNRKKVRDKCHALFLTSRARKFMAFFTFTYPLAFSTDDTYQAFNTLLTRLRKDFNLRYYLWVAEEQNNSAKSLHFHLVTTDYMPVKEVNRYNSVCIANIIKKKSLQTSGIEYVDKKGNRKVTVEYDQSKYNGVDVERVDSNRKRLGQYLTKYISKNVAEFDRLPWHCSREVSELFTTQCVSCNHPLFASVLTGISKVNTLVIDSEYFTVEYFSVPLPDHPKDFFNPPEFWYHFLRDANEKIMRNDMNFTRIKF